MCFGKLLKNKKKLFVETLASRHYSLQDFFCVHLNETPEEIFCAGRHSFGATLSEAENNLQSFDTSAGWSLLSDLSAFTVTNLFRSLTR